MKTLFEKIIDRELAAEIVAETKELIAIKDKFPKAPVHLLIITKKPIPSLSLMQQEEFTLMGKIVEMAQNLAEEFGIKDNFRFLTNNGPKVGQSIFHLHFHLMGGKNLDFENH